MLDRLVSLAEDPYTAEDDAWDAFVAGHPHGSLLQTTRWARLKNRFGWQGRRVWLRQDGRLTAGAQVMVRSAALGLLRVAYIPHGPLVDWQDEEQVGVLFNLIDQAAYEMRAGMLKMEPMLWQEEMPPAAWEALCARHGCRTDTDTIQPPRTMVVDLRGTEAELLARMKQKTRYNISLAGRSDVAVRVGTTDDLAAFNQLMHVTGRRNDFGLHQPAYYRDAYTLFAPEHAALVMAEYEGRPLAAVMAFRHGRRAAYLYGASSDEERPRMASYAAQWGAMSWARQQGCVTYDLWGVPDRSEAELEAEFGQRSDGLWGVYRFKRGFGGELKRTVGAADRVYNQLVYRIYRRRRGV
jgi:lipid II:glycine glycyltransferase (peptidoglycan interpeptide bridge formation enzyme)